MEGKDETNAVEFQFQYGTIKSLKEYKILDTCIMFQFQYGTIKSIRGCFTPTIFYSFNSNMVRLKVFPYNLSGLLRLFQFQYGTIKRCLY